jgi:hypothetical protein
MQLIARNRRNFQGVGLGGQLIGQIARALQQRVTPLGQEFDAPTLTYAIGSNSPRRSMFSISWCSANAFARRNFASAMASCLP